MLPTHGRHAGPTTRTITPLLSITVPVREETGSHLPGGRAWFAVGEPASRRMTSRETALPSVNLSRTFGQPALDALADRVWANGTLAEEWDGLHD